MNIRVIIVMIFLKFFFQLVRESVRSLSEIDQKIRSYKVFTWRELE